MKPYKILIVEDDPEMAAVYFDNFKAPDFDMELARNGQEALEKMKCTQQPFVVVISDRNMPEMDGITMLKKIRESNSIIRAVFVSGMASWAERPDAKKLQVDRFLKKPVRMGELKQVVLGLCRKYATV